MKRDCVVGVWKTEYLTYRDLYIWKETCKSDIHIPPNQTYILLRGVYEVCGLEVCDRCVINRVPDLLRPLRVERDLQIRDMYPPKSDLNAPQRCVGGVWVGGAWEVYKSSKNFFSFLVYKE